jgi:hypothetical protein
MNGLYRNDVSEDKEPGKLLGVGFVQAPVLIESLLGASANKTANLLLVG